MADGPDDTQLEALRQRLYAEPSSLGDDEVREVIRQIRLKGWTVGMLDGFVELQRRGVPLVKPQEHLASQARPPETGGIRSERSNLIRPVLSSEFQPATWGMDQASSGWSIQYQVRDPRIGPGFPRLIFKSVRDRKYPIFGKVIGVRWIYEGIKESFFAEELVSRLSRDESVARPLIESGDRDVAIDTRPGFWVLRDGKQKHRDDPSPSSPSVVFSYKIFRTIAPTKDQLAAYEAIAQHLLATPISTDG